MKSMRFIPWYAKILVKILLSRMPMEYGFWRRLSLFKHGAMEQPDYALSVFEKHLQATKIKTQNKKLIALELGPGDSLFSALLAKVHGFDKIYLVDDGHFAMDNMSNYVQMADHLSQSGYHVPSIQHLRSVESFLELCRAEYMTEGLDSLRKIPDNSVDFIWSQAVLEHVKLSEFGSVMQHLKRIIKKDGISSHCVDLRDHLADSLNHLRFTQKVWESNFMSQSGFYTNRLRYLELLQQFKESGFEPSVVNVERWPRLPIFRRSLSQRYQRMTDEELSVSVFDVILRPT